MRAYRVVVVVALAAVAVAAAVQGGVGFGGGSDEAQPRQTLALGLGVGMDPHPEALAYSHTVPAGVAVRGVVAAQTRPDGAVVERTQVMLDVTAVLDLRQTVLLNDQEAVAVRVDDTGSPSRTDLAFKLPPLEAGRHCLVVAMLEQGSPVGIGYRSVYAVPVVAGDGGPDHCRTGRELSGVKVDGVEEAAGCEFPSLTNDPAVVRWSGRFTPGATMWATVGPCRNAGALTVSTMLYHDGRPVLDGRLAPFQAVGSGTQAVELGALPAGAWWVTAVVSRADDVRAYESPPSQVGSG